LENQEFNGLQAKEFIKYLNRDPAKILQSIGYRTAKHAPNKSVLFSNVEDPIAVSPKNLDI